MVHESPRLGFLLHEVARLLRKRFEQKARSHGLTRSQWQAIAYIARNEGIPQGALADLLEIESITLVHILDKLAGRELIERRHHPTDRRTWLLYLKEAARPLLLIMERLAFSTYEEAYLGVSKMERDRLLKTLSTMKTNLIAANRAPVIEDEAHYG
jgi:DNA-binding MarR family transcriptional regulator